MAVDNSNSTAAGSTGDGVQKVETLPAGASFDCEISITGSVTTENTIAVQQQEDNILKFHEACEPVWSTHTVDNYECENCEEEFDTEAEAREHLERKYTMWKAHHTLPGVPHNSIAESVSSKVQFHESEQVQCEGVGISIRPSWGRRIGHVKDGAEYLIASSRRSYALPPNYGFDSWEPLDGGKLTFPDGSPRIGDYALEKAVRYLSIGSGDNYDSEKFTLYDRGLSPFVLVANGEAVAISPKLR